MLRLLVAKHVEFKNSRLQLLYNVLQLSTLAVLSGYFLQGRLWAQSMDISHLMGAELWVIPGSQDDLERTWAEKATSPVCSSPELYNFMWDTDGAVVYEGHECISPCGQHANNTEVGRRCLLGPETHHREAQNQVFFVTQFEERLVSIEQPDEVFAAFVPLEEAHRMGFRYGYSVPEPSFFSFGAQPGGSTPHAAKLRGGSDGHVGEGILTVVLDADGDVIDAIEPRQSIELGVRDLLAMAGDALALDSPNPAAGPNHREGSRHPEGGLGRITGLNVDLHVECHQRQLTPLPGRPDPWLGPTCYMWAERSSTFTWASADAAVVALGAGAVLQRSVHGLRVRVIMDGRMDFLDANQLFVQLTAILVFLALPRTFMFYFINHALGHLSAIYKAVVIEHFDVQMEVARVTARLMSASVAFVELEDILTSKAGGEEGVGGCISRHRVEEQLREVLKYRSETLDDQEKRDLVKFCHRSVLEGAQHVVRPSILGEFREFLRRACPRTLGRRLQRGHSRLSMQERRKRAGEHSDDINIDDFSMCGAASDRLEFDSFVRLFDRDRGATILERAFLPPKLRPLALSGGAGSSSSSAPSTPSRLSDSGERSPSTRSKADTDASGCTDSLPEGLSTPEGSGAPSPSGSVPWRVSPQGKSQRLKRGSGVYNLRDRHLQMLRILQTPSPLRGFSPEPPALRAPRPRLLPSPGWREPELGLCDDGAGLRAAGLACSSGSPRLDVPPPSHPRLSPVPAGPPPVLDDSCDAHSVSPSRGRRLCSPVTPSETTTVFVGESPSQSPIKVRSTRLDASTIQALDSTRGTFGGYPSYLPGSV